jgi:hypothetical protein
MRTDWTEPGPVGTIRGYHTANPSTGPGPHNIVTLQWGFSNGVPVAADMNGDGVTDIGLYVPQAGSDDTDFQAAGWYWLVSQGTPTPGGGTINTLQHAFNPAPFGTDLYFTFGNGQDLPLVGHWDPQLPTQASTLPATPAPTPTPVLTTTPVQSAPESSTATPTPTPTSTSISLTTASAGTLTPAPTPTPAPAPAPTPTKDKHTALEKKHKLDHRPKHNLTVVHKTDGATPISRKPPTFLGRRAKMN